MEVCSPRQVCCKDGGVDGPEAQSALTSWTLSIQDLDNLTTELIFDLIEARLLHIVGLEVMIFTQTDLNRLSYSSDGQVMWPFAELRFMFRTKVVSYIGAI